MTDPTATTRACHDPSPTLGAAGCGRTATPDVATYGMPVTRFDITEFVGDLFATPVTRAALVAAARRRGARPAVLLVLRRLPARSYRGLWGLWCELPGLADSYDPWEDCW